MQYKKSKNWIRARIAHANVVQHTHTPQPIVAIADVTFFKRSFGVLVIRAPHLKKNIYVQGVHSESIDVYRQCQVFLKLDKSAFLCASSLAPRTLGLLFLYAVEIGKEIALFSIPTATTT